MIGIGEVLVVDWGIAKVLGRHDLLVDAAETTQFRAAWKMPI